MNTRLLIVGWGAVTPVGWTAPQTCAAVRAAAAGFRETGFEHERPAFEPLVGGVVPFDRPPSKDPPFERLVRMAARAIEECVRSAGIDPSQTALLLGVKELHRVYAGIDDRLGQLLPTLERELSVRFHPASVLLPDGNAAVARGLERARGLLSSGGVTACLIAGVDSFLNRADLRRFGSAYRIKNREVTQGFIPGEAAAGVVIAASAPVIRPPAAEVIGVGLAEEEAGSTVLGEAPPTGRALLRAGRAALQQAGVADSVIASRISDVNGEPYRIFESILAAQRCYRTLRARLPVLYPAGSVGEVGAATGALQIALAVTAMIKGYAPGAVAACETSSDAGARGVCVVRHLA